jgi:hypothetical protein
MLNVATAEQTLRLAHPHLLHEHERIDCAFGMRSGIGIGGGHHQSYFTSHRILILYNKGVLPGTNKRQRFTSLPYTSISAWSLEITTTTTTAARSSSSNTNTTNDDDSWKGDLDLKVWSSSTGMAGGLLVMDLATTNGTELFALQHYLNGKVLLPVLPMPKNNSTSFTTTKTTATSTLSFNNQEPSVEVSASQSGNATSSTISTNESSEQQTQSLIDLVHWLGKNNALAIANDEASEQFMRHVPILLEPQQEEHVQLAWGASGGRGCTLLTNERILTVTLTSGGLLDRHHQKLSVTSWPWRSVGGWKVTTSGALLDTADTVWTLSTTVVEHPVLALAVPLPLPTALRGQDIELWLARALLGDTSTQLPPATTTTGPNEAATATANAARATTMTTTTSPKTNAWWFEESTNHKPLPATELNAYYHDVVPLLLSTETVELAFRGRYVLCIYR